MSTSPLAPAAHPGAPTRRNMLGLVSLATGIALLVWNVAFLALQASTIATGNIGQLGLLGVVSGFVVFILAATGLTCGIIGLVQRDRPRIAAGIGTGLGIAGIAGLTNGLLLNVLITLFGG